MRTISLSKAGLSKARSRHWELRSSDVEDSLKSFTPGEWCRVSGPVNEHWLAFVNPLVEERFASVHIVGPGDQRSVEDTIREKIQTAYARRLVFSGYAEGCRAFYGSADGLPGLIVDKFENAAIAQINTAGVDKYRDLIRETVREVTGVPVYMLDNQRYREKEGLPLFKEPDLPDLSIRENGLTYRLSKEVIQKVGFYYDHRENRLQLRELLSRMKKLPSRGLDLFSYAGAWGLNALMAGTMFVDFVDQGDFDRVVEDTLSANGFTGRGKFHRADVFKFLDASIAEGTRYDLLLCDPPAFAKNLQQKSQALEGYSKLHRKVLKLASPGALCVFSSCTHYVDLAEFQKNIVDASYKENRHLRLLHCGVQGWDHPVNSFEEKSNYIKSFTYLVES